jgi:two-component system, OmpR family, response regulator
MAKNDKKVRIFSALEVANICGVVNQTAINWIKNGYLKAFTTPGGQYRVYSEDLVDFLHSRGMRMPDELQRVLEEQLDVDTILIVDDDRDLNNLVHQYLSKKHPDFEIYQAFDGFEAGRMLAERKPGLVVLDIDLPGVNGHKLARSIKEASGVTKPIIVAVSGLDDPAEQEAILKEGADAFLAKPLELDALHGKIEELISKRAGGE